MSSASAYRTHRYSHPFLLIPVISPITRPVAFGLAANLKVISQSSWPALRARGSQEQHLAGGEPFERVAVDARGQKNSVDL